MSKLIISGAAFAAVAVVSFWLGLLDRPRPAEAGIGAARYSVIVQIEGLETAEFESVQGLDIDCQPVEFRDGNDVFVRKLPGRIKYGDITLKKGFVRGDGLYAWYQKVVLRDELERKSGSVILFNERGSEVGRFNFFDAWPCKWKGFSLAAPGAVNLVEEIELAVGRLERE